MTDESRTAKREEAAQLGFIIRLKDADGLTRYILTEAGRRQWAQELIEWAGQYADGQ